MKSEDLWLIFLKFNNILIETSYLSVFLQKTCLRLLSDIKYDLINFPLKHIKFFEMVINAYELENSLFSMLKLMISTFITIWKIRPTAFWLVCIIIYDYIISKRRSILLMHSNSKFPFKRPKFTSLEVFIQGKNES